MQIIIVHVPVYGYGVNKFTTIIDHNYVVVQERMSQQQANHNIAQTQTDGAPHAIISVPSTLSD